MSNPMSNPMMNPYSAPAHRRSFATHSDNPTYSPPSPEADAELPPQILTIAELEQRAIEQAIVICEGSAAKAARKLGISEATIYRKLKIYGTPKDHSNRATRRAG